MTAAPVWVQKFGGTSLATPPLIENAVHRIDERRQAGYHVVVVVSAMGDTTDRLLALAQKLSSDPPRRELDVLLSAGEMQSMALLGMALSEADIDAISFTGAQGGILTDDRFSEARIRSIDCERIERELGADRVVVVAGFQGVTAAQDITTLGRGGSDTSAVALAAALAAERCEILTDVDGVYTADPRVVPTARLLERVSYDEMLEMATLGARVLHNRSVDMARRFGVPITVGSATRPGPGTSVEELPQNQERKMEECIVRAVTHDRAIRKVSLVHVPDSPGVAGRVFAILAAAAIDIRLIVQAQSHEGHNDITFVVPEEAPLSKEVLDRALAEVGGKEVLVADDVGLLSVVGEGIAREPSMAATIFQTLATNQVNIDLISTSHLVISCVVPEARLEDGARALHAALVESG